MPPTTKEFNAVGSASQKVGEHTAASGTQHEDTAGRSQPVALEVPVTVNGARTVEGSDKREPFSESTQTVLVFGNGAVIRLASTVSPGQLLFLTNDKTKKEVVCQVVKSKNYRSVSGYVELEFTEAVAGFWGMRFPGERLMAPSAVPTSTTKLTSTPASNISRSTESRTGIPPTATKHAEPNLGHVKTDSGATARKESPLPPAAPKFETHPPAPLNLPRASEARPTQTLPEGAARSDSHGFAMKNPPQASQARSTTPSGTEASDIHTSAEALKLESARLQGQLSSLLWATPPSPSPTQPGSTGSSNKPPTADPAAKVVEIPKKNMARPQSHQNLNSGALKMESALDAEEVKIPSWLEPLARNAALPAQAEVPTKSEAAPDQKAEKFELQEIASAPRAQDIETVKVAEPIFDELPSASTVETHPVTKNKGILIGAIAAGVLILVAGGLWLLRRPSSSTAGTAAAATQPPAAVDAAQPLTQAGATPVTSQASTPAGAGISSAQANPQSAVPSQQPVSIKAASNPSSELLAYKQLAEPVPTPKKPVLGQVRLAAPTIARNARSPEPGDAGAAPLIESQLTPNADGLSNGLAAAKQPLAPPTAALQTGGDVKPARMTSSIAPVYPMLAKNQHIEGDVRVDALIDASGRVSDMKVVSGPPLLQQAAMDALRQWKYQPATLDGKPVPMHLTVTIQFRMK